MATGLEGAKFLLFIVAAGSVITCRPTWSEAERFREALACGLGSAELSRLSTRLQHPFTEVDEEEFIVEGATHSAVHRTTAFYLWLSPRGLQSVQMAHFHGITGVDLSTRVNLCTGERLGSPNLCVFGAPAGAAVVLDDTPLGRLSLESPPCFSTTLKAGTHSVAVVGASAEELASRLFSYDLSVDWPEQQIDLQFPLLELPGD
jgi:hypothetical protein